MLTILTGPPCSGKSHHIKTHAKYGDIVVDLDLIAAALTITDDIHDYPKHIRAIAHSLRRAAIDHALELAARGACVWIVDSNPSKELRAFYHRRQAKIINKTVTERDLQARLATRNPNAQANAKAAIASLLR